MHLENEVFELRQRVARLERHIDFLTQAMGLEYEDQPSAVSPQLIDLLRRGKKIQAIKVYRQTTGASLKASKEYIETLEDNHL